MLNLTPYDLRLLKALNIEAPEHVMVPEPSSRLAREVRQRAQQRAYAGMAAGIVASDPAQQWQDRAFAAEADAEHHRWVARQWRYAAAAAAAMSGVFLLLLAVKGG